MRALLFERSIDEPFEDYAIRIEDREHFPAILDRVLDYANANDDQERAAEVQEFLDTLKHPDEAAGLSFDITVPEAEFVVASLRSSDKEVDSQIAIELRCYIDSEHAFRAGFDESEGTKGFYEQSHLRCERIKVAAGTAGVLAVAA